MYVDFAGELVLAARSSHAMWWHTLKSGPVPEKFHQALLLLFLQEKTFSQKKEMRGLERYIPACLCCYTAWTWCKTRTGTNTLKYSSGLGSAGLAAMDLGFLTAILNSQDLNILRSLSFIWLFTVYLVRCACRPNFSFHCLIFFSYDNLKERGWDANEQPSLTPV